MMKISSINGTAKKAALGAMLAGSVAMFATNPNRTTRMDNPPQQTEVLSKDGVEALKAITLPQQKQTPTVPTVHNKTLDEKFLKLARDDEEKKFMEEYLSNIYNNCGSYLASAKIQQNIDLNMFLEYLDGNIDILKKFDGEYRVTPESKPEGTYYDVARMCYDEKTKAKLADLNNKVGKWIEENYFSIYADAFRTDHPPDYDETSQMFENFLRTRDNYEFLPGYKMFETLNLDYVKNGIEEKMSQSKASETQKKMDIFAVKINYTDFKLFFNLFKMYYDTTYDGNLRKLLQIYMQAIKPSL